MIGDYSFHKEQDFPDWPQSIYEANAESNWTADPGSFLESRVMDVRNLRRVVVVFKPVGGPGEYSFSARGGEASRGWFDIDGGVFTAIEDVRYFGINVRDYDYLSIVIDGIVGFTSLPVEMAPLTML